MIEVKAGQMVRNHGRARVHLACFFTELLGLLPIPFPFVFGCQGEVIDQAARVGFDSGAEVGLGLLYRTPGQIDVGQ